MPWHTLAHGSSFEVHRTPAITHDTMMTKRILPILSAIAIGVAALTGCQDSSSVAPATTSTDDGLFKIYALDESAVDTYAALPASYDEALNTLTPSSNPPGRGGDDSTGTGGGRGDDSTGGHGGRGGDDSTGNGGGPTGGRDDHGGLTRGNDIIRILRQLNLSDEQMTAIRGCFEDYKACVRSATERYRAAVQSEREELRSELARLKNAVDNGDLTPEEARAIFRQLLEDHRATARDLKAALRTALENCRAALIDCITSNLDADQLAKWERLFGAGGPGRG